METILKNIPEKLFWLSFFIILILICTLFIGYKIQWDSKGNFRGISFKNYSFSESGEINFLITNCGSHKDPCSVLFTREFVEEPICIVSELNPDGTGYSRNIVIKKTYKDRLEVVSMDGKNMYFNWLCG